MPNADTTEAQTGQNATGGANPEHQFVSKDELTAVVNSAVTSQLKRSLGKELGAAIEGAMAPLKAEIEKIGLARIAADAEARPEPRAQQAQDDASKAAANKQQSNEPDPKFVALEAKLAKLEADNKKDKDALARERRSAVEARAHGELRSQLTGKVRPEAVSVVADLLRARNQILIDNDGNARIKVRARLEAGLPEEDHELSLEDGLPHFLKSKEAALFVPPPAVPKAGKTRLAGDASAERGANNDAASSRGALNAVAERLNANINDLL